MNNLITQEKDLTLDSREVARMVGKRHDHLIRDTETYIQHLENPDLGNGLKSRVTDFFIESIYKSGTPLRSYKKYDCTKKGCEFIAHKLTGQKGTLFTATYINKFHEMEQGANQPKINSHKQEDLNIKFTRAEAMLRNAKVREARFLLEQADKRKELLSPESYELLQINGFELLVGKNVLPRPKLESKLYDLTGIASKLGIYSNSGSPHAQAIGAIITKLDLAEDERVITAFDRNGHQGSTYQYTESVVDKVREWLKQNMNPRAISLESDTGKVRAFKVSYN